MKDKRNGEMVNTIAKYLTIGNYLSTIALGHRDAGKVYEDIFASVFNPEPENKPKIVETKEGDTVIRRGNWRQSLGE